MEDSRSILNTLNLLDFDEWINIPKPLIQTLVVFKQCFFEQARKISDCYQDFDTKYSKIQLKFRNMNESIANTNSSIRGQQETILKKVKERCEFLVNDFNFFKNKVSEENAERQQILNQSLGEINLSMSRCVRSVSNIVSRDEVENIVNDKSVMLQQTIINEVRDHLMRPKIDKLGGEIKSGLEKQNKAIEILNGTLKEIETNTKNEINDLNIDELRKIVTDYQKEFSSSIYRSNIETSNLSKQIENLSRIIEEKKAKDLNAFEGVNESLGNLSDQYKILNKKVEAFETAQLTRNSRSSVPLIVTKKSLDFKDEQISADLVAPPTNKSLIENELKSYKFKTELELKFLKSDMLKSIKEELGPLEEKLIQAKQTFESASEELKQKLSWLPINLKDLNGMAPSDARLFTIEARLRAEENSRIKALTHIEKSLKSMKQNSISPVQLKNLDQRKCTPEPRCSLDFSNKPQDTTANHMEGVIFGSFENVRPNSKLKANRSIDYYGELQKTKSRNNIRRKMLKKS